MRHGGARFENAYQTHIGTDQRNVNAELVVLLDSREHVDIARYQRTLRNNADGESTLASESLEDSATELIGSFGGLIRIGCRAEDDLDVLAGSPALVDSREIPLHRSEHRLPAFDENSVLERFP